MWECFAVHVTWNVLDCRLLHLKTRENKELLAFGLVFQHEFDISITKKHSQCAHKHGWNREQFLRSVLSTTAKANSTFNNTNIFSIPAPAHLSHYPNGALSIVSMTNSTYWHHFHCRSRPPKGDFSSVNVTGPKSAQEVSQQCCWARAVTSCRGPSASGCWGYKIYFCYSIISMLIL